MMASDPSVARRRFKQAEHRAKRRRRRTDGDRKHVMLSATEWLKQKDENNNIVKAPRDGQVC